MLPKSIFLCILIQYLAPGPILNYIGPRGSVFPKYEPVASHSDPFRARKHHFGTSQNANICYRTLKILIFGPCMYCKNRNVEK